MPEGTQDFAPVRNSTGDLWDDQNLTLNQVMRITRIYRYTETYVGDSADPLLPAMFWVKRDPVVHVGLFLEDHLYFPNS